MPDDTQQNNNQNSNNQDSNNQDSNSQDSNNQNGANNFAGGGKKVTVGIDHGGGDDQKYMEDVAKGLESCGYEVTTTTVDPNQQSIMRGTGADFNVFLCNGVGAATIWSFTKEIEGGGLPHTIFAFEGWYHNESEPDGTLADLQHCLDEEFYNEHDAKQFMSDSETAQMQSDAAGLNVTTVGDWFNAKSEFVSACYAKTPEEMAQNICSGSCGSGTGSGGSVVSSGGGAQIKDTTFERCIRRICAATDSVFIVDNNVAVLFPYTDWLAFTLRQKITTITDKEIDPNIFTTEYNNDGFYNKVSIAWGGATLPERFPTKEASQKTAQKENNKANYTMTDIMKNMSESNFTVKKPVSNTVKTKKGETTQELSIDDTGASILSEQYDALVKKYGVLEKRVQSNAPDLETAQYIVNALLIQYIRDFNNSCRCRAISNRKYQGGTFYAVTNPFTKEIELQFLNGYSMRMQKKQPLYHDLDFRYGPEGAEELADYQTFGGGASSGGTSNASSGPTGSEESIWQDAAKCKWAQDQPDCSTNDPEVAKKHYDEYTKKGEEVHFDCFGMSAYLYGRFNNEAKIPCQVVGNNSHKVVMLDRGNGFVSTKDEYRKYKLDYLFKWRENQDTTVLLAAPNNVSSAGGNTSNSNNNNSNTNDSNKKSNQNSKKNNNGG